MFPRQPEIRAAIGCLQLRGSDDVRNVAGGQEVIFLHRNQ